MPDDMAAPRFRVSRLVLLLAAIVLLVVTSADDDADEITRDPTLPTSAPVLPLLLPTGSTAAEVAVHVAERFLPFASRTTVGPYSRPSSDTKERDAFRVMFSFTAYAYTAENAAAMDCFSISSDGSAWQKAGPDTSNHSQAFCTRRDLMDDSSTYGVAVFRKRDDGPTLVHAARDRSSTVIAQAVLRGLGEPPLAVFRVQRLQQWQVAPSLSLVTNVTSISVLKDAADKIQTYCPPDSQGNVNRMIDGGNYYADASAMPITVLCVSYVERSLHDLNDVDKFFTDVRLVPLSYWRFNVCPWGSNEVLDAVTHLNTLVASADQEESILLCYKPKTLTDEDDPTDLTDTYDLLKRITVNESEPNRDKRIVIEHHDEDAWTFKPRDDDVEAINSL